MATIKPESPFGRSQGGDLLVQAGPFDDRGSGAGTAGVSRVALTGSFVDGTNVYNMEDYDTAIVGIDNVKGTGTGLEVQAIFGDTEAELLTREPIEDDQTAGKIIHTEIDHQFPNAVPLAFVVKRLKQFFKLRYKSLGSPDASDQAASNVIFQVRER